MENKKELNQKDLNYEANPALQNYKRHNNNQNPHKIQANNKKTIKSNSIITNYNKSLKIDSVKDLNSFSQTMKAFKISQTLPNKNLKQNLNTLNHNKNMKTEIYENNLNKINNKKNKDDSSNNQIYNKKAWLLKSPTSYQMKKNDNLIGYKTSPRVYNNNLENDKIDMTLTADTTYSKKLTFDGDSTLNNTQNNCFNDNNIQDNHINKFKNTKDCFNDNNKLYNNYLSGNNISKSAILNIEDILMLSDKYMSIINSIKNVNESSNECFEWWNFYFNSSLCNQFDKYFIVEKNKKVIQYSTNLELFSIILIYDLSFNPILYNQSNSMLLELIANHYNILILISKYLYSKIVSSGYNVWIKKLENLIKGNKTENCYIMEDIKMLCRSVINIQRVLIKNYSNFLNYNGIQRNIREFIYIFQNINNMKIEQLNNFYRDKIFRILNKKGSVLASKSYMEENKNLIIIENKMPVPYLNKESLKKYTLVLDLDETLIHFKMDPINETKGILQFRPGLYEFLDGIEKYFELVIFTASTKDYADPIIDAIEQNKLYFDYRLYRNHTTIMGRDFIKDISKLGRDLSKVIIVDNMSQNFKLQKDNGITIRSFWGKDVDDLALIDLLPILLNIAKNNLDVRDGISLYKNDILDKVTSNIFRAGQKNNV
jgi:Dullard-like phosphatase family protein